MRNIYKIILFQLFTLGFGQVIINEYSASNLTGYTDNYNKAEDWIELYNPGISNEDIGGYYLSDDSEEPMKWEIPNGTIILSNRYLTFWCSGRDEFFQNNFHTNFKLKQTKNNPDFVVFSDSNGNIINNIELQKTQLEHSVGRSPNASGNWKIFIDPTLNGVNSGSSYTRYAETPNFNIDAGFHSGAQSLEISTNEPLSNIYFTTDGTKPNLGSSIYSYPIFMTNTQIVKAIILSNDPEVLPSFIAFNTYFINESHSLPIISAAANQLTVLLNGNQSLKPHGTIEYFDAEGERKDYGYGEYNKHGQDSWQFPQRSFDYIARDEMGYHDAVREKLLSLSDRDEFQRLIIRASGDDNYPGIDSSAHMRDIFIQKLANKNNLNVDMRRGERCVVYANGQFWGIYSIREKVSDADYTNYYYGQDKYHTQYLMNWGGTWAQYGGEQAFSDWNEIHDFALNNDLSIPSNYNHVADIIDVTSLVDYVLINSFVVCTDWINWNTSWWRGLNPDGTHQKWGYILWDEDATFHHYINYTNVPDESPQAEPCYTEGIYLDPEQHIVLLNRLLNNSEFRQYYYTRYMDLLNTAFQENEMINVLEGIESSVELDMPQHIARWGGSMPQWRANVQKIKDFIRDRIEYFPDGLNSCYDLNGPYDLTIDVQPENSGQIKLNSILITEDQYPWTGKYHGGIDMKMEAYQINSFNHWISDNTDITDLYSMNIQFEISENENIIGVFSSGQTSDLVINEINYNSNPEHDSGDWVELYNTTGLNLNISNYIFKDQNNSHQFVLPIGTRIDEGGFFVICKDSISFLTQFPEVENYICGFNFGLGGDGDLVRIYDSNGYLIDAVQYNDNEPWPVSADSEGATLELIDFESDNSLAENWLASFGYGTPGQINSVSLFGDVNFDGNINVVDIILLANMIIESEFSNFADLNEDGEVNVVDIIVIINLILDLQLVVDATTVNYYHENGTFNLIGDGYIGAVQMDISHKSDFSIELTDDAFVADYKTEGNSTILIIVAPESQELFKTDDPFLINEILVTNSQGIINVNIPTQFELSNPYPNPFNNLTNIKFSIPIDSKVTVKIYDLLGKEMSTLVNQELETGFHNIIWDADHFSSGVYFVKLMTNNFNQTQKIILLK